jgi:5-methylcytosine-specific restriction endonuclease McrA
MGWGSAKRRKVRQDLYAKQGGKCHWCQDTMSLEAHVWRQRPDYATFDHLRPISRGGSNAVSNVVLCCAICNHRRGNVSAAAWQMPVTLT